MASITALGVGSGLDLTGLLDQLRDAERGKLEPLATQKTQQQAKISAYGQLQSALTTFQDSVAKLNDASLYQSLSTNVSGDAVSAAAGSDVAKGQYAIEVEQLATSGSLASARLEVGLDEALTGSEQQNLTLHFANAVDENGAEAPQTVDIAIAANSTLEDIRDAINAHDDAGVTASIVNDGEGYRLALMSSETGKEASVTDMTFSESFFAEGIGFSTGDDAKAITDQTGQDAVLKVNGIPITSASNQVEGAIQGMTLDLAEVGSSTVKVEQDTRAVREAITGFVEAFNDLKGSIGELTAFNGESGAAGDLLGDSAVRTIESRLRSALSGGVAAEAGGFAMLSDIGISLKLDGTLEIDEERLDDVIVNDQDALSAFFAGDGVTDGLAGQLSETVTQLSGDNGALGGAISGAENRIESLGERHIRMERSIEQSIERYRIQFSQLDGMIAQMNSTSDYLTQQFDMMNSQLGRN